MKRHASSRHRSRAPVAANVSRHRSRAPVAANVGHLEIAMAWYQCMIRGENFPGRILGRKGPIGFYTTRVVEAASPEEAELKALAELKKDKGLKVPKVHRTEKAQVFFEQITQLSRRPIRKPAGFTFF